MHQLVVLYPRPDSPQAFLEHYTTKHMRLVDKLPGLLTCRYGVTRPLGPGIPQHFLMFEALFASEQAMLAALESEQGRAVAADVPLYSPQGCTMMHFAMVTPQAQR